MTHTNPLHTAGWHAAQAEDLLHTARSASMTGWWHRPYRRELTARAHVHATLAAALPEDDLHQRALHHQMDAAVQAARVNELTTQLNEVRAALIGGGQDLLRNGDTLAGAVVKLMAAYYSYDPEGGELNALHVAIDGSDPLSRAATLNWLVRAVHNRATAGHSTPPIHVTVKDLPQLLQHPVDRRQFERLLESAAAAGVSGVAYGGTSWDEIANRWPRLSDRLLPGGPLEWKPASLQPGAHAGDPR